MATARVDVGHAMLASRVMECVCCYYEGALALFGKWVTERAGMKIVHCTCPECASSWKRIEPLTDG